MTIKTILLTKAWFSKILNSCLPQSCFLCGHPSLHALCYNCLNYLPYQSTVCQQCGIALAVPGICQSCLLHPPPYTQLQTVFSYSYPLDKLIAAAKFHHHLTILRFLGCLMAEHLIIEPRPQVLIPVPLHINRLRHRGYNQALELAKVISHKTGIALDYLGCQRVKDTLQQTRLTAQQRKHNIDKYTFQVLYTRPDWQHIVLIDDVVTTGTTVNFLTTAFLQAGIKRVDVWCCARTASDF